MKHSLHKARFLFIFRSMEDSWLRVLQFLQAPFLPRCTVGQRSSLVLIVPKEMECSEDCSPWTNSSPDFWIMDTHCLCVCDGVKESEWESDSLGGPQPYTRWYWGQVKRGWLLFVCRGQTSNRFANICRAPRVFLESHVKDTPTETFTLPVSHYLSLIRYILIIPFCKLLPVWLFYPNIFHTFNAHVVFSSIVAFLLYGQTQIICFSKFWDSVLGAVLVLKSLDLVKERQLVRIPLWTGNTLDEEFLPRSRTNSQMLSNNSNTDLITGASSLLLLTDQQQTPT